MVQGLTETVGKGSNLFAAGQIRGSARWFQNPADVVGADEDELPELIGFVGKGGMTFLSPILAELKAVVCTAGSLESHLAILCREFEIPCVMAAELLADIADGEEIVLDLEDESQAVILRGGASQ